MAARRAGGAAGRTHVERRHALGERGRRGAHGVWAARGRPARAGHGMVAISTRLGRAELVPDEREHVDAHRVHVHRQLADALRRVRVHEHARPRALARRGDLGARLHRAHLWVVAQQARSVRASRGAVVVRSFRASCAAPRCSSASRSRGACVASPPPRPRSPRRGPPGRSARTSPRAAPRP